MRTSKILIVSSIPAEPMVSSKAPLSSKLTRQFFGEVAPEVLSEAVASFAEQVTKALDGADTLEGATYRVDQIEVSAAVTADGKVGILGSSLGGSVQGAMKFVWKRREPTSPTGPLAGPRL
jgi:hypothetical protein